jgi:hypothetical protein
MSFEEIVLPNFILADLYPQSIVCANDTNDKVVEKEEKKANIRFLGNNEKNIAIVVNDNEAVNVAENKLDFLSKILLACQFTLAHVAIVNVSNNNLDFNIVKEELNPKFLILMGVDARAFKMPLIFPEYRTQQYNGCEMLIAKDIEKYLQDKTPNQEEKRKLWGALKNLFGV